MSALLAVASCGFAQSINKSEAKALSSFLNQTSVNGTSNASTLGIQANNIASAPGVKVENGHVVEIDWSRKNLAGTLNLSNFPTCRRSMSPTTSSPI